MSAPTHLSPLERRFAVAVGALDSVERPGNPPLLGLDAASARPRDAERDRLVDAWARSTTDSERIVLAKEAELQALESFLGPLSPRNASAKRPASEQFLMYWRLALTYGQRLAPAGELVVWMPEADARQLLRTYTSLTRAWLEAEGAESGFITKWLGELRTVVSDSDNYELAPAPGTLRGPTVAIPGRVLTAEATRRAFEAAKRLQVYVDELDGTPSLVNTSGSPRNCGCVAVPGWRNADKPAKRTSEQFVTFWRLVALYGRRPEIGPSGERFPWMPESDARALAKHYDKLAAKWLDSDKIKSALQPGFIKRWRAEGNAIVEADANYEQAPPPPAPTGPIVAIKERVLKAEATRRLLDATARLQLHFDVIEKAPSTVAVWTEIVTSTISDTAEGVVSLPVRAVNAATKNLKPWLIGGAVVLGVGGMALVMSRRDSHDHR